MKRIHPFWILSGLTSMAANLVTILGYLSSRPSLGALQPNPGLVAALSFVLLAYGLAVWSALAWRWAKGRRQATAPHTARAAAFLLIGLAMLPLLTVWLNLLFTIVLYADVPTAQRWLVALAHAWVITPFVALGLTFAGEALEPVLTSRQP